MKKNSVSPSFPLRLPRPRRRVATTRRSTRATRATSWWRWGKELQALDLDVDMPNASPRGRDEYRRALDLYDRANRLS